MLRKRRRGKCPWSPSRTCAELQSLFLPPWLLGGRKAVYCDCMLSSGLQGRQHNSPVFPPVLSVAPMPRPCFIVSHHAPHHCRLLSPEAVLGPRDEDIHAVLVKTVPGVVEGDRSFVLVPQSFCLLGLCARRRGAALYQGYVPVRVPAHLSTGDNPKGDPSR